MQLEKKPSHMTERRKKKNQTGHGNKEFPKPEGNISYEGCTVKIEIKCTEMAISTTKMN